MNEYLTIIFKFSNKLIMQKRKEVKRLSFFGLEKKCYRFNILLIDTDIDYLIDVSYTVL